MRTGCERVSTGGSRRRLGRAVKERGAAASDPRSVLGNQVLQRLAVARVARPHEAERGANRSSAPDSLVQDLGPGQQLDTDARTLFESRFGRDFGDVRVHVGERAAAAADGLKARAFTLGSDVVFAAGEYDSRSSRGRALLAHELTHVVQQRKRGKLVQRSLSVNTTPPADLTDPLSGLGSGAFSTLALTEMDAVVHALCDAFHVDAAGNVVASPGDFCADLDGVSGGGKPVGCCCLCALTSTSSPWVLNVTGIGGPRTVPASGGGGDFFLHPSSSSFDFGAWDVTGARGVEDPVLVAGHELCGHGALIERGIHPGFVERVDTNVHDPTVRVENVIRAEQGLPGADRALAAGPHRGESFAKLTLRKFPFNVSAVSSLPGPELAKITLAKTFINANDTWVDLLGHSDGVGSPGGKLAVSQARANNVRAALTSGANPVSATISKTFSGTGAGGTGTVTVSGARFTNVEGRSDFDLIPGVPDEDQRRVDILMPARPAGAEVPNAGTPTAVNGVGPQSFFTFLARRFFGNSCDQRLARSAWF